MRRRRLTVWLLVLLVVAPGARTADPHVADTSSSTTTTEPTTTESMVGRGDKKFGDRCDDTMQCGFRGSVCDPVKHSCQCRPEFPVTNHIDKCGVEVDINGSCFFNEQCENRVIQTECKDGRCACRFEMTPTQKEHKMECVATYVPPEPEQYVDPTMIGILVAMALMFVIICVVLRLFSKARWRENRTIFNTPNPRLMNVSLLRDNKHPGGERRGSRSSNRAPSRQPSMASLRPQSPSASQGSRASLRGSRSSANSQSSRSPTKAPPSMTNNVHSNPDPNVTVEMQEPTA